MAFCVCTILGRVTPLCSTLQDQKHTFEEVRNLNDQQCLWGSHLIPHFYENIQYRLAAKNDYLPSSDVAFTWSDISQSKPDTMSARHDPLELLVAVPFQLPLPFPFSPRCCPSLGLSTSRLRRTTPRILPGRSTTQRLLLPPAFATLPLPIHLQPIHFVPFPNISLRQL